MMISYLVPLPHFSQVPNARSLIVADNLCEILFSLVKIHRPNVNIMHGVVGICWQLSIDVAVRSDLAGKGVVDPVLRAMQAHRGNLELQLCGMSALKFLSEVDLCKRDIPAALKGEGITVILDTLRAHKNEAALAIMVCDVLSNLSMHTPNRTRIADGGGIILVLSAMKKHGEAVAHGGATALWLLSEEINGANCMQIADKGGIDALVGIMTTGDANPRAVQAAACCLANIVAIDKYPPLVIRKGATLLLVAAMESNASDLDLQRRLSAALWRLAATADGCAILAKSQRVVQVAVDAMRLFPLEAGLQLQVAGMFYELLLLSSATEALVANCGASQLLVQAMCAHMENAELQRLCAGVLFRLRASAYRSIDPVLTGCIEALLRAMATHRNNAEARDVVALLQPSGGNWLLAWPRSYSGSRIPLGLCLSPLTHHIHISGGEVAHIIADFVSNLLIMNMPSLGSGAAGAM